MEGTLKLIKSLQQSMNETLDKLIGLTDEHLGHDCSHGCAMGDGVRGLLVHNIDHERMHLGQVHNIRFRLKAMQRDSVARLMAEWLRERAALVGLPDEALDMRVDENEWTIRETADHTLYWEKDSADHLVQKQGLKSAAWVAPANDG